MSQKVSTSTSSNRAASSKQFSLQEVLDLKAADAKAACKDVGITVDGNTSKGYCLDALMRHFSLGYAPAAASVTAAAPAPAGLAALAAQLEGLDGKIEQGISRALAPALEMLGCRVSRVEQTAEALQVKVAALEGEKRELIGSLDFLQRDVTDLQDKLGKIHAEQAKAADEPEVQKRKPILKLTRLPEAVSQASAEQIVPELLETLGVTDTPRKITYRPTKSFAAAAASASAPSTGPPRGGFVLVEFADGQIKDDIYRTAGKLRGTKFDRTHLDDDLTERQQTEKRGQQATYQRLWEEKKKPRWRGSQIYVAGKPYTAEGPPSRPPPAQPTTSNFTNPTPFSSLPSAEAYPPLSSSH